MNLSFTLCVTLEYLFTRLHVHRVNNKCFAFYCVTVCDCVLQNFDRYRCCRLVLDLLFRYDESTVVQMSIAICGILAAKVKCPELLVVKSIAVSFLGFFL